MDEIVYYALMCTANQHTFVQSSLIFITLSYLPYQQCATFCCKSGGVALQPCCRLTLPLVLTADANFPMEATDNLPEATSI